MGAGGRTEPNRTAPERECDYQSRQKRKIHSLELDAIRESTGIFERLLYRSLYAATTFFIVDSLQNSVILSALSFDSNSSVFQLSVSLDLVLLLVKTHESMVETLEDSYLSG